MGAVQSDLKASIVQASSAGKVISPKAEEFWSIFWLRPETAEHVFETITNTDVRGMRDNPTGLENLKTLILRTSLQLIKIRRTAPSLTEEHVRHGTTVLNCVRVLTRILPYVYEQDDARRWEESVFSRPHDVDFYETYVNDAATFINDGESLVTQMVNALLDLLFYTGFTLPWPDAEPQEKRRAQPSYGLWQSGIACDTQVVSSKEFESRRTEILRLILTLESKSIYVGPGEYIDYEVQAMQCVTRCADKRRLQSLLCSLLNTVIKYHPDSWLRFDPRNPQGDNTRETHVKVCLHFLLVNLFNRAPWDADGKDRNDLRLQFSYLHKPKHLQFLADGVFKILRRPLETNANMLSLAQRTIPWTPEMIMLLWEALYTNKKFLNYVVESGRALDLIVILIFYAKESHMEGIGRVCIFCLQTLSAHPHFGPLLNRSFDVHDTLPMSIQIKNFHGKYADYFMTSLLTLLDYNPPEANFWSASLTAIIRNVAPHVIGLGRATSSKLMQTFARLAKPNALLANEGNLGPVSSLLETVNSIVEHHEPGHENEQVLYATWRARERFRALRRLSLMDEDALSGLDIPPSRRSSADVGRENDETEKSRGKRPSDQKSASAEFMAKLASLPLHTTITLINLLESNNQAGTSSPIDAEGDGLSTQLATTAHSSTRTSLAEPRGSAEMGHRSPTHAPAAADKVVLSPIRELGRVPGLTPAPQEVEIFRFSPSIAALYASYYWGLVVSHDAQRLAGSSTGAGIWTGTEIKLFRIKAGAAQQGLGNGISLWSPRGAVDAVGESLVNGVLGVAERARKGISGEQ